MVTSILCILKNTSSESERSKLKRASRTVGMVTGRGGELADQKKNEWIGEFREDTARKGVITENLFFAY